jgi:tripartite-type tricarboxylate transporter receptor subunit TctC
MTPLIRHLFKTAVVTLSLCGATIATAQSYPAKPITIRIGYPAGAGTDAAVRPAVPTLQRHLGQALVVENTPGANGSIVAMNVLNSPADGYTLLASPGLDLLTAPLTVASAKYMADSFKLVGVFGLTDLVLVSPATGPFKNLDGLIAYLKKPGNKELSIGHWGPGSTAHLASGDLQARAGAKLLEVPYKGTGPLSQAVGGGEIDLAFLPMVGPVMGMIQSGRIKALAISSAQRNSAFRDVPLVSETAGFKGSEFGIWAGLFAPARTPDAVIARLGTAMAEWIESPENQEVLKTVGARKVAPMTPQQAAAFFRSESERYLGIAKSLNLVAQ